MSDNESATALRPSAADRRRDRAATDYSTVLRNVQSLGLMDRRYLHYALRLGGLALALAGVWVAFAFVGDHWAQLGIAVALAIVLTQVIFISHDAAHRQIFASSKANEILALILGTGISGISLAWWNNKHNKHHQAPNQIGKDPDIDASVVHFFPPVNQPKSRVLLWLHERQGYWFFPLLVVEALNLHAQSVVAVFTRKEMKRRRTEMALMILRFGLYLTVLFVFLPAGVAVLFFFIQMAVTGVYLGAVFAPAHVGMPVLPQDTRIDFFRRQVLLSRNIAGHRFMTWFMGGLNYQVEHHLFPSMPRSNLRKAKAVVESFCESRSVAYTEKSLGQAWGIVVRHLNRVGLHGKDPFVCPMVASLRPR